MNPRLWISVPADAWSVVLNYLKVSEVDRLLLSTSGQVIPDDAINTTAKVVNLVKPSCFLTAGRFVGAEVVRIPCLATYGLLEPQHLNENVASQIVPLITKMKKLKKLHIGTKDRYGRWSPPDENMDTATMLRTDPNRLYDSTSCGSEFGSLHADLPFLKRLVEDFVASFRSNELPRNLELQFLPGIGTKCCGGSHKQGCTLCRDILEHFPLDEDLLFLTCCYSLRKKIPIILSRTGGRELLQSKSVMLRLLKRSRCLWEDHDQMGMDYDIDDYYPPAYLASAITFVQKDLDLFEDLVRKDIGFDPASLTREEVEEALGCWDRSGETACVVFVMQSAFERLVQVGFQLDVTPGTLNDWRDERALDSGIYVQADNDFERDTIDYYRCLPLEYQEDSSDDEEDIDRKRRAWNQKIGLPDFQEH